MRIEIHAAVYFISKSAVEYGLHHLNLFQNMSGCTWFDTGLEVIQQAHDIVETVGVFLHDLHRLQLFQPGLLTDLVLCIAVEVTFEVAYISDIAHIPHLISQVHQIPVNNIKTDEGATIAYMYIAVYCRSANIHAHTSFGQRLKDFLFTTDTIVNGKCHA